MFLDIAARRADFRALHKEGYFLLPTAWDVGGARRLEALGYAGISTTLGSQAMVLGRNAHDLTRNEVLSHMRQLVDATEIAVNADYGIGFATSPMDLIDNMHMAIDTGVAAVTISDRIGDTLVPIEQAVARIQSCRRAIESSGTDVLLVARTECMLSGATHVGAAIERLVALSSAGAHVLSLAGLANPDMVKAVTLSVAPKPIDIHLSAPGLTVRELGQLGVRRISVGDSFADAAWASFTRTAEEFINYGLVAPAYAPPNEVMIH